MQKNYRSFIFYFELEVLKISHYLSRMEREFDKNQVLNILKNIFELEMSGVVRYTHYSLMIFGSNRLPLVDFFRSQAKESLSHADLVGEHITGLGGHPPINAISIKESNKHDIYEILKETLDHEKKAISTYYKLSVSYTHLTLPTKA